MKTGKNLIRQAIVECRGGFVAAAVFSFFINVLVLVPSLYMMQVYDRVLGSRSEETLLMLTVIALAMMFLMSMLDTIRARVLVRVGNYIDRRLRDRLFQIVYERSLRAPGVSRTQPLNDFLSVRQFLTGNGLFAFFDAPWMPFFVLLLFIFHPMLGCLALGGGIVLFSLALVTEFATRKPLDAANRESMQANLFTENNLRNAEVLEAMGMLPGIQSRWQGMHDRMLSFQALASDRAGVISAVTKFVRIALQSLSLGIGAWLAIQHMATPGVMIAASILIGRALAPVEQAIGMWKGLVHARSAFRRLDELFEKTPEKPRPMPLPAPRGDLSVEGIVAVPPGGTVPTLRGVTFSCEAGTAVGIVGPSAAGKSTLARVIIGVWSAHAGKVRLDGADIHQLERVRLGPHLGYLPQDVELFAGTVAENIARFGEIDSDLVVEAAEMAGVCEVIQRLPQGYDTQLGDGGSALSAGQRQRIGLARALYGNPRLVVLDEPNSNLDDEGEGALLAAIERLKERGSTVLVIAHRPNVLTAVDMILVLRDGALQMYGPRNEVMARFVRPVAAPDNVAHLKPNAIPGAVHSLQKT